jgi:hypothetical protein
MTHAGSDRLLIVHNGFVAGTGKRLAVEGDAVSFRGEKFRALFTPIPNGDAARLVAVRPQAAIAATVRPYQRRILVAALASFALLVLLSLLFARPILRALGDFGGLPRRRRRIRSPVSPTGARSTRSWRSSGGAPSGSANRSR